MARFFDWTANDSPASIVRPVTDEDWSDLAARYMGTNPSPQLLRVLELARAHGVVSIVIEHRYIDADYRSEHSAFYSTTFLRYPSVCDRLHFFIEDVDDQLHELSTLRLAYRGYSVVRPLDFAPVGRTLMPPPEELSLNGSVCSTSEQIHLFGTTFTATGMPFISQDAQYLRCAHASQWMVLRHSTLRYGSPRWLTRDIQGAATDGHVAGRQVPSDGLTPSQMLASLGALGLSPGQLILPESRVESHSAGQLSLPAILCRHVNSQMPPIIVSDSHAWVVVGYTIEDFDPTLPDAVDSQHDRIVFYRHDDAAGPYIRVSDPWNEQYRAHEPWRLALTPLQKKCYLSAERAELLGRLWIDPIISTSLPDDVEIAYRTYAIQSWEFKASITRIAPSEIGEMYRLLHMPRFVWVVEALDKGRLAAGDANAVIGEAIIDGTANHVSAPNEYAAFLSIHVAGFGISHSPDHEELTNISARADWTYYPSGCEVAAV